MKNKGIALAVCACFGVGAEFAVNEKFGIRWDTSWVQRDITDLKGIRAGGSDKHVKTGLTGVYRF